MKKLTEDEFFDRMLAIQRAEAIFVKSGLTNNLTLAFRLYQEVFAERERQLFLSTLVEGKQQRTFMDHFERPLCPECGAEMRFKPIRENDQGIKTLLICSNEKHTGEGSVLYSENDLAWWMNNLKQKGANERSRVFKEPEEGKQE